MAIWPYNTQRWQRLRRMKLRVNPLCELCLKQKRIVPAVAVDHIVPVKAPGGEAYPALDWLMSVLRLMPQPQDTLVEQLGMELPIKGCDIHGYPFDPRHPWYSASPLRETDADRVVTRHGPKTSL